MNGVTSEQMLQHGIVYKQNYGVAIPCLREIAKQYPQNHDLAQRLWALKIRETMILATLLEPEDKFSFENAFEWIAECVQIELVEQLCMNLLSKLSYTNELCCMLIKSDKLWNQITGFILSARIYQILNENEVKLIVSEAIEKSETSELHLYKAIALSLSRLSRKGKDSEDFIMKEISIIEHSNVISHQYILYEVKEEISLL